MQPKRHLIGTYRSSFTGERIDQKDNTHAAKLQQRKHTASGASKDNGSSKILAAISTMERAYTAKTSIACCSEPKSITLATRETPGPLFAYP